VWFIPIGGKPQEELAAAVQAAGDEARRVGLPLIVHATGLTEAKAALRAGARLLVHSVWEQPVDDELIELALRAGTIYCPTLTVMRGYHRLYEAAAAGEAPEIDDPNGCVDAWTLAKVAQTARLELPARTQPQALAAMRTRLDETDRLARANLKRVAAAGVPVAMGTDAGNPLTLHGPSVHAEMEAMQAAGLTPMQVIVASTQTAARAMGLEAQTGTVQAGKAADLLVLDADPSADVAAFRKLRLVVRAGVVRPVAELSGAVRALRQPGD
jgi:imidazolonepropionase-like amidohydrolase